MSTDVSPEEAMRALAGWALKMHYQKLLHEIARLERTP